MRPDAESLERNTKSSIHRVHAASSEYPGKERTVVGKNKSRSSSAKSLALQNSRIGPTKRLDDNSDVSKARLAIAKNIYTLKANDKATFFSPAKKWVLPSASSRGSCEREFAVDSGASMHMVSEKDLNSAELATMRTSRSPTTVMTANTDVQTREEPTVFVKHLDLFVKDMLLEESPVVLSLVKLCEDHGKTYHWTRGQKSHLIRNGKKLDCNISHYVPFVVPGLSASSSSTAPSPTSSSSSPQDSVFDVNRYTENPVPERSGSMSEQLR